MGWMSDFHPFNKDLVADPSPKILVIVDRDQTYGDFWRVCLTAEAQEREMKEINAAAEEARLLAEAIEAERLRVEEEARKAATAVYDDSPIVAKEYVSETREATFEDVAALDVVPERPLMQFQLSRPADSIGEPRVFADLSADNEMFTESRSTKNPDFALERKEMSVSVQACKVKVCVEIKFYGAFVLNRRVVLHAIDAPPARWRGDAGSSSLDGASTAASCTRRTG